jgi:hypothetical protein
MAHGLQHGTAFRKISPGCKTNQQSGFQRPMNRRPSTRRHFSSRGEQRPIQVDGDHFELHGLTIA